eukprot:c7309_g1_i2.p1 GENE.c7309_g1_i2~~c7309_g1_i2.p1  ORF type:complete len:177 (-),score=31.74 c7309_g1_i2:7-537(-)
MRKDLVPGEWWDYLNKCAVVMNKACQHNFDFHTVIDGLDHKQTEQDAGGGFFGLDVSQWKETMFQGLELAQNLIEKDVPVWKWRYHITSTQEPQASIHSLFGLSGVVCAAHALHVLTSSPITGSRQPGKGFEPQHDECVVCLHAHFADHITRDGNVVGERVLELLQSQGIDIHEPV